MKNLLLFACLAAGCTAAAPSSPTDPTGELSAHQTTPRAWVRVVMPSLTIGSVTPDGYPVSGVLKNWGNACATHLTGSLDLSASNGVFARLTFTGPDALPVGQTTVFRACCLPPSVAGANLTVQAAGVRYDSGC